jgi:hypothetical protein
VHFEEDVASTFEARGCRYLATQVACDFRLRYSGRSSCGDLATGRQW